MFCVDALDVAAELELPVYYFYAAGAATLAVFLNLPGWLAGSGEKVKDLGDSVITFPGVPPFKASDLPSAVTNDSEGLPPLLRMFDQMPRADGILINSFDSLEARAVRALRDGLCVPGRATPPVKSRGGNDHEKN